MWSSSLPVSQPVLQSVTCECVDYRPQWCLMVWELMLAKLCWMFRHNALLNCSRSVELLSLIERRFCLSWAFHWNGHHFKLSWPHHTECFRQPDLWQPYTTGCFAHIHRCSLFHAPVSAPTLAMAVMFVQILWMESLIWCEILSGLPTHSGRIGHCLSHTLEHRTL